MRHSDRTHIGGMQSRFQTTQWQEIGAFARLGPDQQRKVLDALVAQYWKPVYCYLRRKGNDNETAKDLTQGFFHEIVMGRGLIERADAGKGRFRTFLLTALDHYVASLHRYQSAAKRRPANGVVRFGEVGEETLSMASKDLPPDQAFTYAWARDLLGEILEELEDSCKSDGKEVHWELFRHRILEPLIEGREPPSLTELCGRFDIASPVKAENMIVTVRRRFKAAMKRRVREYVASDEDTDREIRELMEILSR